MRIVFFSIIASAFFLTACVEVIDTDIPGGDQRYVIQGRVTNLEDYFTVKVSQTLPVDGDTKKFVQFPVVSGATVVITDNMGNVDTLEIDPTGYYYRTKTAKKGIPGRVYTLSVTISGVAYVATDELLPPPTLDSIYLRYKEAYSGIGIQQDGNYLYCTFKDTPNEKNFYRFDVRQKCCLLDLKESQVFDDIFLTPTISDFRLPGIYAQDDYVVVNLYSLTNSGYNYYRGLALQLQNDGGFFSTPPANPTSNLSGGALGFFLVSSMASDTLNNQ